MACSQRFGYRSKSEGWDFGSLKELLAMPEQALKMSPRSVTAACEYGERNAWILRFVGLILDPES
jgi:hypothetical protein